MIAGKSLVGSVFCVVAASVSEPLLFFFCFCCPAINELTLFLLPESVVEEMLQALLPVFSHTDMKPSMCLARGVIPGVKFKSTPAELDLPSQNRIR